jgi:hypothetical protein
MFIRQRACEPTLDGAECHQHGGALGYVLKYVATSGQWKVMAVTHQTHIRHRKSAALNETPFTKPLKGQTVNRLTGNQVWTEPRNVADCAARGAITLIR